MWSSLRAHPTASVMPHVEWSPLKSLSKADLTHTQTDTGMSGHTNTVKCLSCAVSWLALKCFSLAGCALSFNSILWHLLHGPLSYVPLYKADTHTHTPHTQTLKLQKHYQQLAVIVSLSVTDESVMLSGSAAEAQLTTVVKHVTSCSCAAIARQTVRQ